MRGSLFSETNYISKIAFTGFIVLASFLIFFLIGFMLAIPIFGVNLFDAPYVFTNFTNPENLKILKYFQVVQSIGLFVVPPFIIAYLFSNNGVKYLSLNKKPSLKIIIISSLVVITALPVINFLAYLNGLISLPDSWASLKAYFQASEENSEKITQAFLSVSDTPSLLFNIFLIAAIPAVGEELLFRGILQKLFAGWFNNVHWAIFVVAVLFSTFHFQFSGFIPRLLLGMFFGYLLIWFKSLWLPIIGHFINNFVAVVLFYLKHNKIITSSPDTVGNNPGDWLYVLLSLIAIVGLIIFMYRTYRLKKV